MKMKNLLQVLVVFFFVFSCTKDTFEEPKVDDTNERIAADQFDNSYLGVYKGLFSTNDGLTRGSVVVTLSPTNEGIAQITLSSGEMIELKSSKIKLTADNMVSNLRFSSAGLSEIDATLDFSVEADGLNPVIAAVNFDNKESDILIAKNLSRAPLTTITGTYMRTSGTGGFPTTPKTWNVMAIGSGNQTYAAQIFYGNRLYTTPPTGTQNGCTDDGTYETCAISGMARILGYDVNWSGTHTYSLGTTVNESCSDINGTWSAPGYGNSSGTFTSDTDCSGPLVSNDTCATAISVGAGTYTGSTNNASNSDTPAICTAGLAGTPTGPGVWYTYTSPTTTGVIVDTEGTVGFDTQLRVLSGSCGSLTCIEADDDDGSGLLSTITFTASGGVTYYFFLGGYNSAVGNYTLNVTPFVVPANELCANATAVAVGTPVSGSTLGSSNTGAPATSCNGVTLNSGPGVWHTYTNLTAASKLIRASTVGSNFDTRLGVLSGACGALTCVTANDNGPTGVTPQSELQFTAAPGVTYRIYVTAAAGVTGNYSLNLTELFPPVNDQCGGATAIACGGTASGSTATATNTGAPATCDTDLNTAPGVWYSFSTPNAQQVTVNTVGSDFDTKLGVFSGTCGAGLVCVAGNDQGGFFINPQSQVIFSAAAGTTYYFYVTGAGTLFGNYVINVTCEDPATVPANDLCANAASISCGTSATGNTTLATTTGAPSTTCGTALNTSGGVWYNFTTPTTKVVTVNTTGGNFDTKLGVFSGACTGLVCVAGNDDGGPEAGTGKSQVIFTAAAGTAYKIYVTGFQTAVGTFNVNVTCADPPPTPTFSLTPGCGTTLVDNGVNANYSNNRNDTYSINAGAGNVVRLPFTVFNLENSWDYMRLFNSPDGTTLGTEITNVNGRVILNAGRGPGFTGTGTGANSLQGQTVVSAGQYLIVRFISDGNTTAAGFLATVGCAPARTVDDSHIRTSATFMPTSGRLTPKVIVNEERMAQDNDRKKLEAYKKSLNDAAQRDANFAKTKLQEEARSRELEANNGKIFYNEADRIEYNRKHKKD